MQTNNNTKHLIHHKQLFSFSLPTHTRDRCCCVRKCRAAWFASLQLWCSRLLLPQAMWPPRACSMHSSTSATTTAAAATTAPRRIQHNCSCKQTPAPAAPPSTAAAWACGHAPLFASPALRATAASRARGALRLSAGHLHTLAVVSACVGVRSGCGGVVLVLVGVAEDHRENKPQSVGVLCAPSLCLLFNACYGFSVAAVLLLLPQSLGHAHHHDEPCTDEATAQVRSWW